MKMQNEKDILVKLFREMPDEQLPSGFRNNLMLRIQSETIRVQKRKERFVILCVVFASLIMILTALFLLVFNFSSDTVDFSRLIMPQLQWPSFFEFDQTSVHFYTYVGLLVLALLIADNRIRHSFFKKKEK